MDKRYIRKAFLTSIGNLIARKRKNKNITQTQLGKELNVSAATISKYEHGLMDMPLSNLPLISNYCKFPMSDYIVEWNNFNLKQFIFDSISDDYFTPNEEVVSEYINSCTKEELDDTEKIYNAIYYINNEDLKEAVIEIVIENHMKRISEENRFRRLLDYYKNFKHCDK